MGDESSVSDSAKSESREVANNPTVEKKGRFMACLIITAVVLLVSGVALLIGLEVAHVNAIKAKLPAAIEAARQRPMISLDGWSKLSQYHDHYVDNILPGPDGNSVIVVFGCCDYSQCGVERLETAFLNSNLFQQDQLFTGEGLGRWAIAHHAFQAKQQMVNEAKDFPLVSFTELLSYEGCVFEVLSGSSGVCQIIRPDAEPKLVRMEADWWSLCYTPSGYKIDCEKIFTAVKRKEREARSELERRRKLEETARELDKRRTTVEK